MREFIAIIVSFAAIPILSKKKVPIGISICICALLMGLLAGLNLMDYYRVISTSLFTFSRIQQLIVVTEVSVIGVLLKKYGIIDQILFYLLKLIRSRKLVIMAVPALIGMLTVPGGAIMSAPLVDELGEKSNITKPRRAVINLIYRHIAMHIMPYASGFLIVLALAPQVQIYSLIGINLIFVAMYVLTGYVLYIRKLENCSDPRERFEWKYLWQLLKYTSPIYVAILLNLSFKLPFYIGMLVNLSVIYFIKPSKQFFKDTVKAFNFNVIYALVGVYLIQGMISNMDMLTAFLIKVFSNPNTIMIGIISISLFFGIATGFQPSALGIILPILTGLGLTETRLLFYCHFTFVWAFVGYYFSPLHLCQLFTCEYMGVKTSEIYKEYWKLMLALVLLLIADYFILSVFM